MRARIQKLNLPRHIVASLHVRTYSTKKTRFTLTLHCGKYRRVCDTKKYLFLHIFFTEKVAHPTQTLLLFLFIRNTLGIGQLPSIFSIIH